eukprot:128508-Pyramimonas_sp.AAC.1
MMRMLMMMMMMRRTRLRSRGGGRKRTKRRMTSVNLRAIDDVGIIPPSKLPFRRPQTMFISIEGTASLEDNRLKILKHTRTLFSGFQRRHVST